MPQKRKIALNENYFDDIDTPEKAYWLGFLVTDGSIYYNDIELKLGAEDATHLDKYVAALDTDYPVLHKINNFGRPYARVRVGCLHMVKTLAKHGVMQGKPNNQPWGGPVDLLPHYWRGAIDGDGWITTKERMPAVGFCGRANMVDAFIAFADTYLPAENRLKPLAKIAQRNIFQVLYGGVWGAQAMCRLLGYGDLSQTALDRKRERALTILAITPKQKVSNRTLSDDDARNICLEWNAGDIDTEQLASKYNVGKGTIYNITHRLGRYALISLPEITRKYASRHNQPYHAQNSCT
jgi:hypothetical protein